MIEHVDAIVDLRRYLTLELASLPGKAAEALDDLRDDRQPWTAVRCRRRPTGPST